MTTVSSSHGQIEYRACVVFDVIFISVGWGGVDRVSDVVVLSLSICSSLDTKAK